MKWQPKTVHNVLLPGICFFALFPCLLPWIPVSIFYPFPCFFFPLPEAFKVTISLSLWIISNFYSVVSAFKFLSPLNLCFFFPTNINISHWFPSFKLLSVSLSDPHLLALLPSVSNILNIIVGQVWEGSENLRDLEFSLGYNLLGENWEAAYPYQKPEYPSDCTDKGELQLTTTTGSYFLLLKEPHCTANHLL